MDSDVGLDLADHVRLAAGIVLQAINRFDDERIFLETQPEAGVALHQAVKELMAFVRDLTGETDRLLIASMNGERKALVGQKLVEVRRAYRRFDWDHARLAERVAIIALGGEVRTETKNIVDALLAACRPEWRVTALKDMGLRADDYCSRELNRATVSVT